MSITTLKARMAAAAGKAVKAARTSAFLGVAGCILAGGIGFAEARAAKESPAVSSNGKRVMVWRRIATASTDTTSNVWLQGTGLGVCNASSRICTAQFEDGYDPNDHSYETNAEEAITFVNGYKSN